MIDWNQVYHYFKNNRIKNEERSTTFTEEDIQSAIFYFLDSGKYDSVTETLDCIKLISCISYELTRKTKLYSSREEEFLKKYKPVYLDQLTELDLEMELKRNIIVMQAESLIENELSTLHRAVYLTYINGFKQIEIAAKLNLSVKKIRKIIKETSILLSDKFAIPQESIYKFIYNKRSKVK